MTKNQHSPIHPAALLFLGVALAATPGVASIITIGGPIEGNSWKQRFEEKGVGNFDTLAVVMTSEGDSLKVPGMYQFSKGEWEVVGTPDYSLATADSPLTTLRFFIGFEGSKWNSLSIDFYAFDGEVLKEAASAVWVDREWHITDNPDPLTYQAIADMAAPDKSTASTPEPVGFAVWSLLAVVCMSAVRRRR